MTLASNANVVAEVIADLRRAANVESSPKLPLSKTRLHHLLGLYEGRVTMDDDGGYDKGVVFRFTGKRKANVPSLPRIVAGRLQGPHGFESEAICATPSEVHGRRGLERFLARVERRRAVLQRWADEYYATTN